MHHAAPLKEFNTFFFNGLSKIKGANAQTQTEKPPARQTVVGTHVGSLVSGTRATSAGAERDWRAQLTLTLGHAQGCPLHLLTSGLLSCVSTGVPALRRPDAGDSHLYGTRPVISGQNTLLSKSLLFHAHALPPCPKDVRSITGKAEIKCNISNMSYNNNTERLGKHIPGRAETELKMTGPC